jgi:hypothetical protein
MHLFRGKRVFFLTRLGVAFLLLTFLTSAAHTAQPSFPKSHLNKHHLAAVLPDRDNADGSEHSNHRMKAPLLAPDGKLPGFLSVNIALPAPVLAPRFQADIPFRLPMHFLYTQLTSSAL